MTAADLRGAFPPSLWLQAAVMLIGIGVTWGVTTATSNAQMAAMDGRIAALERAGYDRETRLRSLELGASRQDEKLLGILAGITDLRMQLGRIEEQLGTPP